MLTILRVQPPNSAIVTFLNAAVSLRHPDGKAVVDKPDIQFSISTYQKIARNNESGEGDQILLPINLFFATLTFDEQVSIYEMYTFSRDVIGSVNKDNRREIQAALQQRISSLVRELKLDERLIAFCTTERFIYPDLSTVGTLPHHSPAKTYMLHDYIEITAISLFSKMMVPIWGEFIEKLSDMGVSPHQREDIVFSPVEPSLEYGAFERIYGKLSYTLHNRVEELRKTLDKRAIPSGVTSSFIITHNGIDDQMFDSIIMATIIVKRLSTYECFARSKDGNIPNAIVYIDDGIKRTADTRIQAMRRDMDTLPRRELTPHDTDDNSSILDHASKVSKKPVDDPIFVQTAAVEWEIPRLIVDTDTPVDVLNSAADYYQSSAFDISPLCQALMASFVGTRFGGSKPIGYLSPRVYQHLVVMLQIFLIRNEMYDLASLVSSKTSPLPSESVTNSMTSRIQSNLKSPEYLQCQTIFKGYLERPVHSFLRKPGARKQEVDRIDFTNQITRMVEWLVRYTHSENMAPALWEFSKLENRPLLGSECYYDENTIRNLCKFYLIFHSDKRPF